MKIKKEELRTIIITSLILGFVFGFDDKKEIFNLSGWTANFILQIIQSALFITIFIAITKYFSDKKGVDTEFKIWRIKTTYLGHTIYGIALPILVTLISYGKMFFPAVLMPSFSHKKTKRLGKKYEIPTGMELARISSMAPLIFTIIAVLLNSIKDSLPQHTALIPLAIAISLMLPIPKLNGGYVFFGSPTLYMFCIAFIILSYILMIVLNPLFTILLALLLSFILMITYHVHEFIYK